MAVVDLVPVLARLVASARSDRDFRSRFWAWLDAEAEGPLGPLLSDMERLWAGIGAGPTLAQAQGALRRLDGLDHARRAEAILARVADVYGRRPDCDVVLVAGLRRPEGYSRFDRGRNTVFVALDHPAALADVDHFEVILAHELTHALRDPTPEVQVDYGGWSAMSHDDFVARYPFREHFVSEALATSFSERAYPGKQARRYVFFDEDDYAWCERNRRVIADRILEALRRGESYRTFYAEESVAPGSPDCCDYYLGFHLGRYLLAHHAPADLVGRPASALLGATLEPFLAEWLGANAAVAVATSPALEPVESVAATAEQPDAVLDLAALAPEARNFYRDLLVESTSWPEEALQDERDLAAGVAAAGLTYGDAPYDVLAFPLALAPEDERYLRWVAEGLLRLIERVVELYRSSPAVRAYFALPAVVEELACTEPGFRPLAQVARFDCHWNGRSAKFIELNTHGTAGLVLSERLSALYRELPLAGQLLERHPAEPLRPVEALAVALRAAWTQARGTDAPPPRVAIVDWASVPTRSEQVQLAEALAAHELPTRLVEPSALSWDGEALRGDGAPIDLVYRRFTTLDLAERAAALEPLIAAYRAGAVVLFGPFASDVAHSKRLFAFLTDERWRSAFGMEERALIDAHIPWTRLMRPGPALYHDRSHDLAQLAVAERERFVLKPTEGYEGRDVLLGIETPPDRWAGEVERRMGGPHVLQEYVPTPRRTVLVPGPEGVRAEGRYLHLGPYLMGGRLAGFLARLSVERVLSAVSTERVIPSLLLRGRWRAEWDAELSHP